MDNSRDHPVRRRSAHLAGLAEGLLGPGLGTFAAMTGFGSLAADGGMPLWAAVTLTVGVWSMPGQIAFVDLYATDIAAGALGLVVAIANVRMLPLTIATIPLLRSGPGVRPSHFVLAQINSVTSYVRLADYANGEADVGARLRFYAGFTGGTLVVAPLGTVVGFALAGSLPAAGVQALVFVTPVYLLLLTLRSPKTTVLVAVGLGCVLVPATAAWLGSTGIVAGGLVAGTGAFFTTARRRAHA